jgi:hypothetical protein
MLGAKEHVVQQKRRSSAAGKEKANNKILNASF